MQENFETKSEEFTEEAKKILGFTESQIFDYVKKITIEIEATIFMEHNKNNRFKIMTEYVTRFRVILANLKDDSNFELRLKILTGQMTPPILSKIDEKVIFLNFLLKFLSMFFLRFFLSFFFVDFFC